MTDWFDWDAVQALLVQVFEKENRKGVLQLQLEPDGNGRLVWRYGHAVEAVRCSWASIDEMIPAIEAYLASEDEA